MAVGDPNSRRREKMRVIDELMYEIFRCSLKEYRRQAYESGLRGRRRLTPYRAAEGSTNRRKPGRPPNFDECVMRVLFYVVDGQPQDQSKKKAVVNFLETLTPGAPQSLKLPSVDQAYRAWLRHSKTKRRGRKPTSIE
jgi:hypothetical protein